VLRWLRKDYIVGVPARDLSEADIVALKLDAAALVEGGVYEWAEAPKAAQPEKADKAVRPKRADKAAEEGEGD
jgi:hypothetical protein